MGLPVEVNNLMLGGDAGYRVERSLRFRAASTAYMNRTPSVAGNRRTWTWSGWVKRGRLDNINQGAFFIAWVGSGSNYWLAFNSSNQLEYYEDISNVAQLTLRTTAVYRDPSAWYHVVLSVDTTQATAANRVRIYVNGVEVTSFATSSYPAQNYQSHVNNTTSHGIGGFPTIAYYFDGYVAEVHHIDGQALTPSSFGQTDPITGVWVPKKYAGSYGTNGYYLKFTDNSGATATTIGKDFSGNGNNWTPNNISVTAGTTYDSMLDSPTNYADGGNGRGNYCVLNPLDKGAGTVSNGNLTHTQTGGSSAGIRCTTALPTTGKWYWEAVPTGLAQQGIGIAASNAALSGSLPVTGTLVHYQENAQKNVNGTTTAYGATYTANDVIGVAYDADANSITFYKNNVSQGAITPTSGVTYFPWIAGYNSVVDINFGQRPFTYTPPSGFKALNTQNLPDPTIKKGSTYFDATLWSGDGTSNRLITNASGFSPDLAWIKCRSIGPTNQELFDTVRGASNALFSNLTNAEATDTDFVAFNSNGFTVTAGANNTMNVSGRTYVSWCWDEGATPGFDIVTYTGTGVARTVAHNLGVAPSMMIVKTRSAADDWRVYHQALSYVNGTAGQIYMTLNSTAAYGNAASVWNNTNPTSTVFTVGTDSATNGNGRTYVAYLWSEVPGFSRFGSYVGNGSSDGTFVWLGFRPAFFLVKASSGGTAGSQGWSIADNKRLGYNLNDYYLFANSSAAEGTGNNLDLVSNGVKMRGGPNENGTTYVYAAFAENPFKIARAR